MNPKRSIFDTRQAPAKPFDAPTKPVQAVSPSGHPCYGETMTIPERIGFILRDGRSWSYPTALIALVTCPSPSELILSCRCGEVSQICIEGTQLQTLADLILVGRLLWVKEAEHFFSDGLCIHCITLAAATEEE